MKVLPPTEDGIREAAEAIRRGEVIAYPTETVYGLAVDPFSESALERLFAVKGRDPGNPVLLLIGEQAHLSALARIVTPRAKACMERFWPGPLSLVLPAAEGLPSTVLGSDGKVCLRYTSCPSAQALCVAFGGAITSTSANRSGQAPARTIAELALEGISIALDGGELRPSAPSTVYDPDEGRVLRQGAIGDNELNAATGAVAPPDS